MVSHKFLATARLCFCADMRTALQAFRACEELERHGLGCIVEACDSAATFLVGRLQDWADKGTLMLQYTVSNPHA